jgi:hypothetical protein
MRSEPAARNRLNGGTAVVVAIVVGIVAAILLGLIPAAMVARHAADQQALMAERIATLEKEQAAAAAKAMEPPPPPVVLTQVVAVIPTPDGPVVTQVVAGAAARGIEGGPSSVAQALDPVSLVVTQLWMTAKAAQERQDKAMAAISENVSVVRGEVAGLSNSVFREVSVQREETRQQFVQTRGEIGRVDGRVDVLKTNAAALEGWLDGSFRGVFAAGKPTFADDLARRLREAGESLVSLRAQEETMRNPVSLIDAFRHYRVARRLRKQETLVTRLQTDWDEKVAPWVRLQEAGEARATALRTLHGER